MIVLRSTWTSKGVFQRVGAYSAQAHLDHFISSSKTTSEEWGSITEDFYEEYDEETDMYTITIVLYSSL